MDEQLRALASPVRRSILSRLRQQEVSASDIAAQFTMSRPAISQHLKVLADAGMVRVRCEGTRRLYSADAGQLAELRQRMDAYWDAGLPRLKAAVEREMKLRKGRHR